MKNVIKCNLANFFRSIKAPSVFALAFFSLVITSNVQATDKINSAPVEIKHVGNIDGKPVFEINIKNVDEENVQLSIRDEYGVALFSEVIKGKSYSRKIQFENLENNDLNLTLALRSKKGQQIQEFKISNNTRLVQQVKIAAL